MYIVIERVCIVIFFAFNQFIHKERLMSCRISSAQKSCEIYYQLT